MQEFRYFISAELKAKFSKENIRYILERGIEKGYRYYEFGSETEFASVDLASEGLMKPNVFGVECIMAKIGNIVLNITVTDMGDSFSIGHGYFENMECLECVDFFLSLIKDFAILSINTSID